MRESAAEYHSRHAGMLAWNGADHGWKRRSAGDVAYVLEALGATPDGFARVLALAADITPGHVPAGLVDVAPGFRIGVNRLPTDHPTGEPLGVYGRAVVVAWTTSPR